MPEFERGPLLDDNGTAIGYYREVRDDEGNSYREEHIDKGNGKKQITVKTMDGIEKSGVVEPGTASDQGLGN